MTFFIFKGLLILGDTFRFHNPYDLPADRPLIIVSNHQSLFDIPPFSWYMRKHHVKFVSKKELGKGIPAVSFNLRHGGSVLIDRKNPKQALPALKAFAQYLEREKHSAVIFPEGTRSRNGVPKRFSPNGLKMMVKYAPSALVVPVTINNSWKLLEYGNFPMGVGVKVTFDVHQPIEPKGIPFEELFEKVEKAIKDAVVVKSN